MAQPPATGVGIRGGMPTIFVTNMDRAARFYTDTLGLGLLHRAGDHFAMIDAGGGTRLGLHPSGPRSPKPGTNGSTQVGLAVQRPIQDVVDDLKARGVSFQGGVIDDTAVKLAYFTDPDGNLLYLCES